MAFLLKYSFAFSFIVLPVFLAAQHSVIFLENSSFESIPSPGVCPLPWINCGLENETPPDIHPKNLFQVSTPPVEGKSYLGMVVRDNNTSEGLGQKLPRPILSGQCYRFYVYLARSENYHSISPLIKKEANFNLSVKLQLWGGNGNCDSGELLAESEIIKHTDWQHYRFDFTPTNDFQYFKIALAYNPKFGKPYNGNLLLDGCSPILPINCEDQTPLFDTQKMPTLESQGPEALYCFFSKTASALRFKEETAILEQHVYLNPKSPQPFFDNMYLRGLVEGLKQLPDHKITFVVFNKPRHLADQRVKTLYAYISSMGLSADQFEIRLHKRADAKRQWWSNNVHLLTRLENRSGQ